MPRKTALWRIFTGVTGVAYLLTPLTPPAFADDTPSPNGMHVVQPGETLSEIASGAGVDLASLVTLNGIDDVNLVYAGQSIKLPGTIRPPAASGAVASPAPSAASALPQDSTYVVADGDTLWGIAAQLGTTTGALLEANQLDDPDKLPVGAQLKVPSSPSIARPSSVAATAPSPAANASAQATPATSTPTPRRSLLVAYTVQPGETLSQIARQFDVLVDSITKASSLDDPNRISIGSVLKIPLPGREHVVKQGETLRDIALQEKVDLGALIDFNELDDPELIRIGQVMLIPAPRTTTAASTENTALSAAAAPAPTAAVSSRPETPTPQPTPTPQAKPLPPAKPAAVPASRGAPSDGLVGVGLKLLGSPYVFGGSSPSGFDCSGFVWYLARQVGKPVSRSLFGAYNSGSHPARNELKPGDLVFFQNTYTPGLSHEGIYIGNNQFVHAVDEATGVAVSTMDAAYWSSRWFGATRLP